MSHVVGTHRSHELLRQRLDKMPTGAPDSPEVIKILEILFSPEEADLVRRVPGKPTSLEALAGKLNIPASELDGKLTDLARRGLMLDFEHEGQRYFMLPPIVVGLFEFVFMRARDGLPMAEISRLFEKYFYEDGFAQSVFQKQTQIGRSLVHEQALPQDDHTEILDWERASRLIHDATAVGVSLCACRHKAGHLGHACDKPVEVCMTLNMAAETMARNNMARLVSAQEALRILDECKAGGMAQTGDNVQQNVSYICNCCGCCCGMMNAVWRMNIAHAIVTSNWIMEIDAGKCTGCGLCAKACVIRAIALDAANGAVTEGEKKKKRAVCNTDVCLGCGVCYSACKRSAIRMKPRERRVLTPETAAERLILMAIERGKLADFIFEDPQNMSQRLMASVIGVLEKTPPVRALMAIRPLRSAFLDMLLKKAKIPG